MALPYFYVNLARLSLAESSSRTDELERIWKEGTAAYFKILVLSRYSLGGSEENNRRSQSVLPNKIKKLYCLTQLAHYVYPN
jgi:hypothetical protein